MSEATSPEGVAASEGGAPAQSRSRVAYEDKERPFHVGPVNLEVVRLTGLGAEAGPAVAGVLAFRPLTFWLPVVPGYFLLRSLRRHHAV